MGIAQSVMSVFSDDTGLLRDIGSGAVVSLGLAVFLIRLQAHIERVPPILEPGVFLVPTEHTKVTLAGEGRGGKSSLRKALQDKLFDPEERSTVGAQVEDVSIPTVRVEMVQGWAPYTPPPDTFARQVSARLANSDLTLFPSLIPSIGLLLGSTYGVMGISPIVERTSIDLNFVRNTLISALSALLGRTPPPWARAVALVIVLLFGPALCFDVLSQTLFLSSALDERVSLRNAAPGRSTTLSPILRSVHIYVRCRFWRLLFPSTPPIETLRHSDDRPHSEELVLSLWDFGGQSLFSSLLHLFLTPECIYLVVFDMTRLLPSAVPADRENCLDVLRRWCCAIHLFTSQQRSQDHAAVMIVGTHLDRVINSGDNVAVHSILDTVQREVVNRVNVRNLIYADEGNPCFFVDSTRTTDNGRSIAQLREVIDSTARGMQSTHDRIPVEWCRFVDRIRALVSSDRVAKLNMTEAEAIARECNMGQRVDWAFENEFRTMLSKLTDLGIVFW